MLQMQVVAQSRVALESRAYEARVVLPPLPRSSSSETRTHDLFLMREALLPLSYRTSWNGRDRTYVGEGQNLVGEPAHHVPIISFGLQVYNDDPFAFGILNKNHRYLYQLQTCCDHSDKPQYGFLRKSFLDGRLHREVDISLALAK